MARSKRYTAKQAAAFLGISEGTIANLIKRGRLHAIDMSGGEGRRRNWRITSEAIQQFENESSNIVQAESSTPVPEPEPEIRCCVHKCEGIFQTDNSARGLCSKHYNQFRGLVNAGHTTWSDLESISLSVPPYKKDHPEGENVLPLGFA